MSTATQKPNGSITIEQPDDRELAAEKSQLVAQAQALVVTTASEHGIAMLFLKAVAGVQKRVADLFATPKKAASAAHKAICNAEGELVKPLDLARAIATRKITEYEQQERRKAEEQARILAEAARKQEEERQLLDAVEAESRGDTAGSDAIMAERVTAPVVVVEPAIAKVEGVTSRVTYGAEITDKVALITYVAAHPEWASFLDPNMPALNALARTQREALVIPGVRVKRDESKSVRA